MYELSDWGRPVAASDWGSRERITAQLDPSLVRVLRSRARAQGMSLNDLIDRILRDAVDLPDPVNGRRIAAVGE